MSAASLKVSERTVGKQRLLLVESEEAPGRAFHFQFQKKSVRGRIFVCSDCRRCHNKTTSIRMDAEGRLNKAPDTLAHHPDCREPSSTVQLPPMERKLQPRDVSKKESPAKEAEFESRASEQGCEVGSSVEVRSGTPEEEGEFARRTREVNEILRLRRQLSGRTRTWACKCAVDGCPVTDTITKSNGEPYRLFPFPNSQPRRKIWANRARPPTTLHKVPWVPRMGSHFICERHFLETDFDRVPQSEGPDPSLNLPFSLPIRQPRPDRSPQAPFGPKRQLIAEKNDPILKARRMDKPTDEAEPVRFISQTPPELFQVKSPEFTCCDQTAEMKRRIVRVESQMVEMFGYLQLHLELNTHRPTPPAPPAVSQEEELEAPEAALRDFQILIRASLDGEHPVITHGLDPGNTTDQPMCVARAALLFPGRVLSVRFVKKHGPLWIASVRDHLIRKVLEDLADVGLLVEEAAEIKGGQLVMFRKRSPEQLTEDRLKPFGLCLSDYVSFFNAETARIPKMLRRFQAENK